MAVTKQFVIALALVVGSTAVAVAQTAPIVVPIQNWSYQRHSSTATEGYLRGRAAVVTAAGQKNYLDSVASVNFQEAVRRNIENRGLYVKTYFENRETNRQYREKYAAVPPTKEQWQRITESMLPDRLTAEDFDPTTGALVWPHILRGEEYAAFRNRIAELMANRTPDNSGDGSPAQRELAELVDAMILLLKSNIDTVSTSQYGAAKSFLLSLDYEAQFSLGSVPVALKTNTATPAEVN